LELQYDTDLKGVPGRYITARTGVGKRMPFKYDSYTEAKNGVNIVTTLDVTMQYLLENQLEKTFVDSEANNRVTGIIMDVNTGAVLAMATYPNFDLNTPFVLDKYSQVKLDESGYVYDTQEYNDYYMNLVYSMWKNKAVSELYEPGSTFKIITASMALEEKVVSTDDKFTCTGAYFVSGYNKPIHCHLRSGHGTVTFVTGFQQSCNPTFMQVAERIGREKFYSYFNAFGFTEKTGIDLPGEASSIFHDYSGFNQVELAVYSFGQTFKCTPLQQLTAISSVANGGSLLTPHMVSSFIDDNGNTLKTFDTEIKRQVISADTGRTISTILEEGVAGNGGAKNAYVAGYKIAAKTGTSEVRDMLNAAGESYLRVGSCVAFAPSDDPQIAAIIIVDQPQIKSVYGSIVAAPYIANLFNELLPSIGIERSYTDAEMAKLNVTVPKFTGWPLEDAIQNLTNVKGIKYEVIGTPSPDGGDVVKYQIPAAGEIMSKDTGKLLLYIGDAIVENYVMVPDLKGYSAGTANTRLANAGLNIHIDGSANYDVVNGAVVTSQTPAAYENVPRGTVVTITLRYLDGTE
jgi:stage V sporulation protein D (sporulation-specific penicillin-binding protein)